MKEIGRVGFMEKPVPEPGPGDAVVRTIRALICRSDSHTVQGGIGPRAITPDSGDLASRNGFPPQSGAPLGGFKFANLKDGVFADYFHVNEADANLAKIPDTGNIPIGGTVAVLAQGPVGLMATAGARLRGAGLVSGVGSVPDRQKLPRTYGATDIVDFTSEDVVDRVLELTQGQGVDTAIEALGADVTFQTAVKITKPDGTVSVIGYFGEGEFVRIPRGRVGRRYGRQDDRHGTVPRRQTARGAAWTTWSGPSRSPTRSSTTP